MVEKAKPEPGWSRGQVAVGVAVTVLSAGAISFVSQVRAATTELVALKVVVSAQEARISRLENKAEGIWSQSEQQRHETRVDIRNQHIEERIRALERLGRP